MSCDLRSGVWMGADLSGWPWLKIRTRSNTSLMQDPTNVFIKVYNEKDLKLLFLFILPFFLVPFVFKPWNMLLLIWWHGVRVLDSSGQSEARVQRDTPTLINSHYIPVGGSGETGPEGSVWRLRSKTLMIHKHKCLFHQEVLSLWIILTLLFIKLHFVWG